MQKQQKSDFHPEHTLRGLKEKVIYLFIGLMIKMPKTLLIKPVATFFLGGGEGKFFLPPPGKISADAHGPISDVPFKINV